MRKLTFFLPLLLLACSDGDLSNYGLNKWQGTWDQDFVNAKFRESWSIQDADNYSGYGFGYMDGDTISSERINLRLKNNKVTYEVVLQGEDPNKPVIYELTEHKSSEWTFENKKHDFPKLIKYTLKGNDSMIIYLEGTENGYYFNTQYRMRRK